MTLGGAPRSRRGPSGAVGGSSPESSAEASVTFPGSKVRHGTPSGHSLHGRLGEKPCDACCTAKAEYDKRWRSAPSRVRKSRLNAKAQVRAYGQLARLHPVEYRDLYEKAKADVAREWGE